MYIQFWIMAIKFELYNMVFKNIFGFRTVLYHD